MRLRLVAEGTDADDLAVGLGLGVSF